MLIIKLNTFEEIPFLNWASSIELNDWIVRVPSSSTKLILMRCLPDSLDWNLTRRTTAQAGCIAGTLGAVMKSKLPRILSLPIESVAASQRRNASILMVFSCNWCYGWG